MFDIGFWELTTIAVIALLVIGPEKLPGVARTTGKWVGRARRFVGDVKTDIDRELKQEELRKALAEDAGLDEIKQIMNTDNFTIDAEETPDYQVKAMSEDDDLQEDEELKHITDHSDGADDIAVTDEAEKKSSKKS
jgi:sec-independent protein translocase protein TatB